MTMTARRGSPLAHPRLQEVIEHIAGWAAYVDGPATESKTRSELLARRDIWLKRIADMATTTAQARLQGEERRRDARPAVGP